MQRRDFLLSSLAASASLILPAQAATSSSKQNWIVGQSVDLSGDNQNMGRDYFTGAKVAFDQSNASGGVHGRKWQHVALDDGGRPEQTLINTRRLINDERANVLFGYTHEPCIQAALQSPDLRSAGLSLFAPMSGMSFSGDERRALYLRATHAEEVAAMLGQFAEGRLSSFVIVHTNGMASLAARDAALQALRQRELPIPAVKQLAEDGSNIKTLATQILQQSPHAVVILAGTLQSALLAKELRQRNSSSFTCVTSSVDATLFQQMLGPNLSAGVVFSRVVPNPLKGTEQVVREFTRALTTFLDEKPTTAGLEGYMAARALIQLTQKSGEVPASLETLRERGTVEFSGWRFDFRHGNRGSRYADTSIITRAGSMLG
jgi:branched-chain amino acid transport system substrate-binding protein